MLKSLIFILIEISPSRLPLFLNMCYSFWILKVQFLFFFTPFWQTFVSYTSAFCIGYRLAVIYNQCILLHLNSIKDKAERKLCIHLYRNSYHLKSVKSADFGEIFLTTFLKLFQKISIKNSSPQDLENDNMSTETKISIFFDESLRERIFGSGAKEM